MNMRFPTIHNSLDNQLEFEINYCGMSSHDSSWLEEHSKPTYAVWLVKEGVVCIDYNNRIYTLNEGDVFFFKPETQYRAWTTSKEGCCFIYILFDVYIGRSLSSTNILQTVGMLSGSKIKYETDMIFKCLENYKRNFHLALLHLKSASIFLITKIITELKTGTISSQNTRQEKLSNLKTVLAYIDENIQRDITVKELADTVHMSEKYFITYFKEIIGNTPFAYITSIKMKKAYEYISADGYSVKHTAELLGYSDQYVFSKAFKRAYGFSPSRIHKTDS